MNYEQAIQLILNNYDRLEQENPAQHRGIKTKAVWFLESDQSADYETDIECVGVTREGKIAWAYASGCSCWDGEFDEGDCDTISIKEFTFNHESLNSNDTWQNALIKFADKI